jgi:hypothetical protein
MRLATPWVTVIATTTETTVAMLLWLVLLSIMFGVSSGLTGQDAPKKFSVHIAAAGYAAHPVSLE